MTLSLDISGDWQVVDGDATTTITYHSRLTESTFSVPSETVTHVIRENITKEEMQARGLLAKAGAIWHIWVAKITAVPKVHDVIEDSDSVRWVVLQVTLETLDTRYDIISVRER